MVHLYWDFRNVSELKKLDPLKRVELVTAFREKLSIPVGYVAGFDKPYIEIESDDPVQNSPFFKGNMIPRPGFINRVAVRHLTHQSKEFINKIQDIASEVLK